MFVISNLVVKSVEQELLYNLVVLLEFLFHIQFTSVCTRR